MKPSHLGARVRARRLPIAAAGTAVLASFAMHAGTASASTKQVALMADPYALQANPAAEVAQFHALGVNTVRVMLSWSSVAPSATAKKAPRFNASSPSGYAASRWAQWDTAIKAVTAAGMKVDLDIMGGPPRWAQGAGVPGSYNNGRFGWKVNAKDYGQFVQAVATRYSGHYQGLPKVSIFSLWNEPNMGQQLGPQNIGATSHSNGYNVAAGYYRAMLRTGYSALRKEAKGATILIGELAGQGRVSNKTHRFPQGLPGNTAISNPVGYVQALYCLGSNDRPLTGTAAKDAACPTSGGARGSFVKSNPALFSASAFSTHPYASSFAPNVSSRRVPAGFIILPVIGRLSSELTKVTGAWHHRRSFPIWSTEYGFITSPPAKRTAGQVFPSPVEAAVFINEAEYLSWRNPQVATYAQYLLTDPAAVTKSQFASGLLTANGSQKPTYDAFRLPLWVPHQSVRRGANDQVWGGARPAVGAASLGGTAKQVSIQTLSGGTWTTVKTLTVSAANGYFNTSLKFSASTSLRLAYTYPSNELGLPVGYAGSTVYSRTVKINAT